MWLMMQQDNPGDYVISTGKSHSIRQFLDVAFNHIGITNWEKHIKQDERFMRPAEVDVLRGDSTKARQILNWEPETSFEKMVSIMVSNDIKLLS